MDSPSPSILQHRRDVRLGRTDDDPVVDVPDKYVYRWVRRAADPLQKQSGDEGWQYVGPHGLRWMWDTYLIEQACCRAW